MNLDGEGGGMGLALVLRNRAQPLRGKSASRAVVRRSLFGLAGRPALVKSSAEGMPGSQLPVGCQLLQCSAAPAMAQNIPI